MTRILKDLYSDLRLQVSVVLSLHPLPEFSFAISPSLPHVEVKEDAMAVEAHRLHCFDMNPSLEN